MTDVVQLIVGGAWAIALARSDWRTRTLPNVWTFGGAAVALALAFGRGIPYGCLTLLTGFFCFLFLLLPYLVRAAGPGDIKMMAAAGLFAGPGRAIDLMLSVSVCGLVLALAMLAFKLVDASRLKHFLKCCFDFTYDRKAGRAALPPRSTEACRVPFGVAIAAGLVWVLVMEVI